MGDHKQLIMVGRTIPGKSDDSHLYDRIMDAAMHRNRHGATPVTALASIPTDEILKMVVGPQSLGFLFKNNKVARLDFEIVSNPIATEKKVNTSSASGSDLAANVAPTAAPTSSSGVSAAASSLAGFGASASANRTAKIRRMMIAARRPDRSRAVLPASSIPEELIAQAQVVLQGKSREVIVRELQRTNLNVNEAVNNLLSRDDDEDEMDDASESYLHEELLSLLDAGLRGDGGAAAVIDGDGLYTGADYDYMLSRETRRRDEVKSKERKQEVQPPSDATQQNFKFADELVFWHDVDGNDFPAGVTKFTHVGASYSCLYALADDGKLYTWNWADRLPTNKPHSINDKLLNSGEKITMLATSPYRMAVVTSERRVGAFMDEACGIAVSDLFYTGMVDLPAGVTVERLLVCPLYAAIQTANNKLYWCDRVIMYDNAKKKTRDEPTSRTKDITVGAEVMTRAFPIYAAGSVGVSFVSGCPMIGILMEAAWTISETCRFRVMTPAQYAQYLTEKPSTKSADVNHETLGNAGGPLSTSVPYKETAWNLKDVAFIKEEPVDGSYVGVVYRSVIEQSEVDNGGVANEVELLRNHLRLMRKDELILVPTVKIARSPQTFQKKLAEVRLPKNIKKVLSSAVDNTGFHILVERTGTEAVIIKTNAHGTEVSSKYIPLDVNGLIKGRDKTGKARLENFGDESVLYLYDANGCPVAVLEDYTNGFREPIYLGIPPARQAAIGVRYINPSELKASIVTSHPLYAPELAKNIDVHKNAHKMVICAYLVSPEPRTTKPKVDSLIQCVQFCNIKKVRAVLKELENADEEERRSHVLNCHTNTNKNILQAAIMNCFSGTNKDQSDDYKQIKLENGRVVLIGGPEKAAERMDTSEAEAHTQKFDQKWNEMVGGSEEAKQAMAVLDTKVEKSDVLDQPMDYPSRQRNAINILAELVSSSAVTPYFEELMKHRDVLGHIPFFTAIHVRAYTAAMIIWLKMREVKGMNSEGLTKIALNGTVGDNPMFVICYNDTCSFTWTGEEHINQDIFECKTCDLVGSLCCCTECAYTCHRDHDCKLKRTSPTAYCDCWEKCGCRALVSANKEQRETLLKYLLKDTSLIKHLNGKGEHLLLFLVKAVGRQLVEQENFPRRSKLRAAAPSSNTDNVPEHDLDPPKFASTALQYLLSQWTAVKSLIEVGLKKRAEGVPVNEDQFQLNEQDGAGHLDKFVFTLLARCPESQLDTLLNTLVREANSSASNSDVHKYISRFVRSVVRLFVFVSIMSPLASNTILRTVSDSVGSVVELQNSNGMKQNTKLSICTSIPPASTSTSKTLMPNYRAITVSGVLSLVRNSLPISFSGGSSSKENKKKTISAFVLKCHRVFQVLVTHSLTELLNMADTLVAPVRLGVAKQTVAIHRAVGSSDVLDVLDRYLSSEAGLSSVFPGAKKKSRRSFFGQSKSSKGTSSEGSDSDDSDNDQNPEQNTNYSAAAVETARRTVDQAIREAVGTELVDFSFRRHEDYVFESNSEDDREEDAFDEDDEEVADALSRRSTNQNAVQNEEVREGDDGSIDEDDGEEDDEDEERYIEEEDDHYYRMDDNMGEESGEEFSDEDQYDYSSDGERSYHEEDVIDIESSSNANEQPAAQNGQERRPLPGRRKAKRPRRRSRNEASDSAQSVDVQNAPQQEPMEAIAEDAPHPAEVDVEPTANSAEVNVQVARDVNQSSEVQVQSSTVTSDPARSFGFRPVGDSARTAGTRQHAFSTQSPSIGWAVRRVRQQTNDNDSTGSGENDTAAAPAAPAHERSTNVADNNNGADAAASAPSRVVHRKSQPTVSDSDVYQTKIQLSACFAILVKVVDDLSLRILQHPDYAKQTYSGLDGLLQMDNSFELFERIKNLVNEHLNVTWAWFQKIMDRIEVMLRFGNALLKSPVGDDFSSDSLSGQRANKTDKKRERRDHLLAASVSSKRDFYNYFMSLARSHSGENGDEMPSIEATPFRHIALIAEAYLYHINVAEVIQPCLAKRDNARDSVPQTPAEAKKLRRFYKRSESLSYPSFTTSEPHNAFKYTASDCVPLAVRCSLLKPESDRTDLFLLPTPDRTVDDHVRIAREHGLSDPTYQSLANPPLSYKKLFGAEDGEEEPMQVDPSPVFTDSRDQHNVYEEILSLRVNPSRLALQKTLGRWGNAMVYLAKAFKEDIIEYSGNDSFNSILLNEVGGFNLKHSQFKAKIEKYRSTLTKDIHFMGMTREKHALVADVFNHLNAQYSRRLPSNNVEPSTPTLGASRIKATFRDEPGEGSGVVRSFYAALADALTDMEYLPKEGEGSNGGGSGGLSVPSTYGIRSVYVGQVSLNADGKLEYSAVRQPSLPTGSSAGLAAAAGLAGSDDRGVRTRAQQRAAAQLPPMPSGSPSSSSSRKAQSERRTHSSRSTSQKFTFSLDTPQYNPRVSPETNSPSRSSEPPPTVAQAAVPEPVHSSSTGSLTPSSRTQRQSETNSMLLGERFFERVRSVNGEFARRITGLIVNGLPLVEQLTLISNDDLLNNLVQTLADYFGNVDKKTGENTADDRRLESLPLFMKTPSNSFLCPIPGNNSTSRRNAFRNVGRMIGICLLQMEIFPLKLCRHVLKFILDRPISWYDLAFYDPSMFDSLRTIAFNDVENRSHTDDFFASLGLTFVADIPGEEGGGMVELLPGGESIAVTRHNVLEYIYLFVEKRLLGSHVPALESIKQGVYDVVPAGILNGLTSEDLRLILCGTEEVSIKLLESFTTFMDESSSKPESVNKFKRWFYSVISKFSDEEKQDLLFFWTGSPSLPSTEEAFTPLPTVMIRPADDHHLPTANTCISRLYLPFYSSKKILRSKLLIAIQTRDFGFV